MTTYTIAQAEASSATGLTVLDTAANIAAALPDPALTGRVSVFEMSAAATLDAAQAALLAGLGTRFSRNGFALAVQDTMAGLAAGHSAFAVATSVTAVDSAANLLAAPGSAFIGVTATQMTGSATENAANLTILEELPAFSLASGATLSLADTMTAVSGLITTHLSWLAHLHSITTTLDGSTISAMQAYQFGTLANLHISTNFVTSVAHPSQRIVDTAHDLAADSGNIAVMGTHVPLSYTVTDAATPLSASVAATLTALPGFSPSALGLTVADTGAALTQFQAHIYGYGYTSITVTSGTFDAPIANLLSVKLHFDTGSAAMLNTSTAAGVAQMNYLAGLPGFSRGAGVTLVATDSLLNLATYHETVSRIGTGVSVTGSGVLSAAMAESLGALKAQFGTNFTMAGNTLGISDTAAALISPANALGVALASTTALSADATVTAANLTALAALPGFSLAGHVLLVSDSAAALAALAPPALALSSGQVIDASANVSAAVANTLAAMPNLQLSSGATLTVQDSVANLLTLSPAAKALASSETVPTGSTLITVAQADALAALGHFTATSGTLTIADSLANLNGTIAWATIGVPYEVQDSAAAIAAAASSATVTGASAVIVSTGGVISAAQATTLAGIAHLSVAYTATIVVEDSAAHVSAALDALELLRPAAITLSDASPDISLTLPQLGTDSDAIASITNPSFGLNVSGTGAQIAADLASGSSRLRASAHQIVSLTDTDSAPVSVAAATLLAAGVDDGASSILAGFTGGPLQATGATVAQLTALLASAYTLPGSYTVSDTGAAISTDLNSGASVLVSNRAHISTIALSSGALELSQATVLTAGVDDGAGSVLYKLTAPPDLIVTGVDISHLAAVMGLATAPSSVQIDDTAANIQGDLTGGGSLILANLGHIGSITSSDAGIVTLTATQWLQPGLDDGAASVAGILIGRMEATGATVAQLGQLLALTRVPDFITVSDSAAAIEADLGSSSSAMLDAAPEITRFTITGAAPLVLSQTVALRAGVDDSASALLSKMAGSSLDITGVSVANLMTVLQLHVPPASLTVLDSAANLQTDLARGTDSTLLNSSPDITAIALTTPGTISLTVPTIELTGMDDGAASVFGKMTDETLRVTGATIADLTTLHGLFVVPTVSVSDSAANIVADASSAQEIDAYGSVTSVSVTDASITAQQAYDIYNYLGSGFDESGLVIIDTASNLLQYSDNDLVPFRAAALVEISGSPTGLTAAQATTLAGLVAPLMVGQQTLEVSDTAAQLLDPDNLPGLAFATTVDLGGNGETVTAAQAAQLAGLNNFDGGTHDDYTVLDTAAAILEPANQAGLNALYQSSVELSADAILTGAQVTALAAISNVSLNGHTLTLADTALGALQAVTNGSTNLSASISYAITDTASNIMSYLDNLTSMSAGDPITITVTDAVAGTPIGSIPATAYVGLQPVIDALVSPATIAIVDDAANVAADVTPAVAADPHIAYVQVEDTVANILANQTALLALGADLRISDITDELITASEAIGLSAFTNVSSPGLMIADDASQIAAAVEGGFAGPGSLFQTVPVSLSENSVVDAAGAKALQSLPELNKNLYTLQVWDAPSHLTDSADGYLAAVSGSLIDGVYLKLPGDAGTISAATAAALLGIPDFHKDNPDGSTNTVTVSDTAAHLDADDSVFRAHPGAFSGFVVTAPATVSEATLADLQALGATTADGVTLAVSDTASAILAATAVAPMSPSLTATTTTLTAPAIVTEAQALTLATLPGFSTGAYALTLSDGASVGVSDANALAALGAGLRLGGNVLSVSGSVAQLDGLSGPAREIVTTHLSDTAANLAALSPSSSLLGGTVTVTDSATMNAAEAGNLLDLLSGAGGNLAPANLSFGGHIETVSDTAAALAGLIGSAAWTQIGAPLPSFLLDASDTVANLISGANSIIRGEVNASTLSSDQTVDAADAQTLAGLAPGLIFSVGTHQLIVSDTAANLLGNNVAAGLALATGVQLSAGASLDAAQTEALLALPHFVLNQNITVSDSSANLLDGALAAAITGAHLSGSPAIVVTLAGNETLDAVTATQLAALPDFNANGHLAIADSSAYLLAGSAATAEADASTVTLAGDELVSANTVYRLSQVAHFADTGGEMKLASNDYANAVTLQAIADMGASFSANAHSLTVTQQDISLTNAEYSALQNDNLVLNGNAVSAVIGAASASSSGGELSLSGVAGTGATVNLYDASGNILSQNSETGNFTVTTPDAGVNVVMTQTLGGNATIGESAPVIVLDQQLLENAANAVADVFANSGQIEVDAGKYVNLYTAGNVPVLTAPALVYDPVAHTLSLDLPGTAPVTLVTLGTATHLSALTASEILIKAH